jgi:ankyrin repeat protein
VTDVAKLLVERGSDVNAQNSDGYTALIRACDKGMSDVAKLLQGRYRLVAYLRTMGGTGL